MKEIDLNVIKSIAYRFPNTNIKNLNIYNNSSNKCLFDTNGKYYILKPKGKRSYLWFTYIEKKILCKLVILNNPRNLCDNTNTFYEYPIKFNDKFCYNNLLLFGYYLTHINIKKKIKEHYFILENVYNYNIYNQIIERYDYNNCFNYKLNLFNTIIPYISNVNNHNVKLPIILDNNTDIYKNIYKLDYNIFSINVYSDNRYLGNYIINNINHKILATFKITSCVNQDLYNLIIWNNNKEEFYDLALIDSYKTSVFMNKLFRNIKENKNLDLLEESDDEEEFENTNKDKFVNLEKYCVIECEYNTKFKKWMPRKLSNNKLITKNNLLSIISKKKSFHIL